MSVAFRVSHSIIGSTSLQFTVQDYFTSWETSFLTYDSRKITNSYHYIIKRWKKISGEYIDYLYTSLFVSFKIPHSVTIRFWVFSDGKFLIQMIFTNIGNSMYIFLYRSGWSRESASSGRRKNCPEKNIFLPTWAKNVSRSIYTFCSYLFHFIRI